MTQRKKTTVEPKRRTRLQDLSEKERPLSKEEQKTVKGGVTEEADCNAKGIAVGRGIIVRN